MVLAHGDLSAQNLNGISLPVLSVQQVRAYLCVCVGGGGGKAIECIGQYLHRNFAICFSFGMKGSCLYRPDICTENKRLSN